MALFVPILRLLMLFLNVYDSYKTLKDPPSSSRHPGRPSIRAMTQRKRDMKGCLALWVVWAFISMYERTFEAVVSLFIPFYDEVKSLALLFLILTRAKGAEPIYLHLIRPLIKPYTRTLDASLELALMIGDFIFALSTYPVRVALEWYGKRFNNLEIPESEETQSDSSISNDVNTSELPTSFLASSGAARTPADDEASKPTEMTKENPPTTPPIRRTSGDTVSSRHASGKKRAEALNSANLEPNFFDSKRARDHLNRGIKSSSHKDPRPSPRHRSSGDNANQNPGKSTIQSEGKGSSSRHQIWYPPKSSYMNDDDQGEVDVTITAEKVDQAAILEHQEYEEWRQYPPFPSAYPPTPLVTTSRLVSTSVAISSALHPPIAEENQQDFRRSLLPPREPLNPIHIRDLSDVYNTTGISSPLDMDDADDSMSNDEEDADDDEDEFNITLRTPLPALGSLRSQIKPRRLVSVTSNSSAVSMPSRSSALTTVNDGSSLPHGTSSDSSLSPSKPNNTTASVIGKKRSYPRAKMPLGRNRVRQVEDETSQDPSSLSDRDMQDNTATLTLKAPERISGLLKLPDESESASLSSLSAVEQEEEEIPPEEKRRKIIRSATNAGKSRAVHPPRAMRSRVVVPPSSSSSSAQPQKGRIDALPVTTKRSSTRLRPASGPSAQKVKENDPSLGAASSSTSLSISDAGSRPVVPAKPSRRGTARKL